MPADSPVSTGRDLEGLVKRLLRALGQVELAITLVAFTFVVLLVAAQIGLRAGFDVGMVWAQEVAQLFMLIAYFFGASYIFKARQYVVVLFVVQRLPRRLQLGLYLMAQALTFWFCLLLVVEIIRLAPGQLRMSTYILHIPRFYSSLPLLAAAASIAVTSLYYAAVVLRLARASGWRLGVEELEARVHLHPGRFGVEPS